MFLFDSSLGFLFIRSDKQRNVSAAHTHNQRIRSLVFMNAMPMPPVALMAPPECFSRFGSRAVKGDNEISMPLMPAYAQNNTPCSIFASAGDSETNQVPLPSINLVLD